MKLKELPYAASNIKVELFFNSSEEKMNNIINFIKNGDDSELNHLDRLIVDQEVELALFQRAAAETKLEMKDFLARKS